jgi:acyl carrier protein
MGADPSADRGRPEVLLSDKGYSAIAAGIALPGVLSRKFAWQNNQATPARRVVRQNSRFKKRTVINVMSIVVASNTTDRVKDRVVRIVQDILQRRAVSHAVLADEDLREAGLNSLDMVNLMLAVEAEFGLEIPDTDMTLRNFRSIAAIEAFVNSMLADR